MIHEGGREGGNIISDPSLCKIGQASLVFGFHKDNVLFLQEQVRGAAGGAGEGEDDAGPRGQGDQLTAPRRDQEH